MNVVTGNVIISLRIENVHCYYLCKHFYDKFKNRRNDNENSVCFIKNNETNEIAIFWDNCKNRFQAAIFLKMW